MLECFLKSLGSGPLRCGPPMSSESPHPARTMFGMYGRNHRIMVPALYYRYSDICWAVPRSVKLRFQVMPSQAVVDMLLELAPEPMQLCLSLE